ncbi:MAG TPA: serine/threonine-protein kinase [Polyangiaceae bacterium]|jgi:serine/threonine-protein kinase|nr:MAG: Tyrosine-protein kinase MasK [Deltaproteobacteria bacterium ADurb.Bin207]HNS98194.1 serine/threonine-protein kinase [Polyangiaceae bacterium]HNZ24573.1 serine/threonine-protein kinase [Polyangiaceae bacterium]HOD25551.1 serine/threonine-protein kinase [Polyangiaceae bacterium]HOE51595.1 serine/threonine-protein kinase [Polyangiaceae bacterium]
MVSQSGTEYPRQVGRYWLFDEIASGGMATVRYGRLVGERGFSRTVAVKCLHAHFAKDEEFSKMFLDEARLAARIQHPNVVSILDVVGRDGELYLVMEYVQGESLSKLIRAARRQKTRIPLRIVASIIGGMLDGLHAAHEATSELGVPLGIVHRDVSPQNVIIGTDGVSRVLDFGVAKAAGRMQSTRDGQLKGKLAYMAPEQLKSEIVDRRTDVYAASVVLWEALTGRRLFKADDEIGIFGMVLQNKVEPPSSIIPSIPKGYDAVTMRGLQLEPDQRFATAREMAIALEKVAGVASPREVGAWVEELAHETLHQRTSKISELESKSASDLQKMVPQNVAVNLSVGAMPLGSVSRIAPPPPGRGLPPPRLPPPRLREGSNPQIVPSFPVAISEVPPADEDGTLATLISDTTASSLELSVPSAVISDSSDLVSSPSQLTSLSMAQERPKTGPKPRVLVAVVGSALLLSLLVVAGLALLTDQFGTRVDHDEDAGSVAALGEPQKNEKEAGLQEQADASTPTAPAVDAAVDASVHDVAVDALASATSKKVSVSTTRPVGVPVPVDTKPPVVPPTQTTRPAAVDTTSKPPKNDCNPPYTIDARGVRVPKLNCL